MGRTVTIERDLTIPMRDGTALVADLYLPGGAPDPRPSLVYRVRGSKSSSFITGAILLNPIVAAERGYAVLIQEVRGRGGSAGEWHPFVHEADDGWDTLEWMIEQPWCNGRIGSYGTAYTGIAALLAAATGHPALEAVVAVVSGVAPHDGWIYTDGAFELGWNDFWAHLTAGASLRRLDLDVVDRTELAAALQREMEDPPVSMERLPLTDQPVLDALSPHYRTWLDHPTYDDYWAALDVIDRADRITARVLGMTGWWDNFQKSHLDLYRALDAHSPTGADQRLVIGPWDHFTYVNIVPTMAGTANFGPAGVAGPVVSEPMALAWFDRWLCDAPASDETSSGVRWFATGTGGWRTSDTWPPPATERRLHLGPGTLTTEFPAGSANSTFTYDPADPTPTVGGRVLMPTVVAPGVQDLAGVARRSDVLTFDAEPLGQDLFIAGNVRVELWASSSGADTDFSAVLVDVCPDGRRLLVADGFVRARHRNGFHRIDWLIPDEVVRYEIDLWDVAWTFRTGHAVGLHVASASFPRFDRNLNVSIAPGTGTLADAEVARQTIVHDPAHPSAVVLPVVID